MNNTTIFNLYGGAMLPLWSRLVGHQLGRGELEGDHRLEDMLPSNDLWRPNRWCHVHQGRKPWDDVGGLCRAWYMAGWEEDDNCLFWRRHGMPRRSGMECRFSSCLCRSVWQEHIFRRFFRGDGCLHKEGHQGRILLKQWVDRRRPF